MNHTSQAVGKLTKLVAPHIRMEGCLPESDNEINNASRNVVKAMHKDHGECWLGKINLYGDDKDKPEKALWKYDGGTVYNFSSSFVVPCFDQELVDLILARLACVY